MEEKEKVRRGDGREWRGANTKKDERRKTALRSTKPYFCETGDSRKSEAPRKRSEFPLLIAIIILTRSLLSSRIRLLCEVLPSVSRNHSRPRAEIPRNTAANGRDGALTSLSPKRIIRRMFRGVNFVFRVFANEQRNTGGKVRRV